MNSSDTQTEKNDNDEFHDEESPPTSTSSKQKKEKENKNNLKPVPLIKILLLAKPEFPFLILSFILMIAAEATGLINPLIVARAYDTLIDPNQTPSTRWSSINHTMMLVFIIHIAGMVGGYLRASIMGISGERVVSRLRLRLYDNMLQQDMNFFDEIGSGDLLSRLSSDTTLIQQATSSAIPEVVVGISKTLVSISLMLTISFKLTLLTVGMTLLVFGCCVPFGSVMGKLSRRYQDVLASAQVYSTEALGSMRTVQSFAAEKGEWERFKTRIGDPDSSPFWYPKKQAKETSFGIGFHKSLWMSGFGVMVFGMGFAALYGSLWYGFKLVNDGEMSLGELTAFQSYVFQIGAGLGGTSRFVAQLIEARGASGRVFELLERVPSIPDPHWFVNKSAKENKADSSTDINNKNKKNNKKENKKKNIVNPQAPLQPSKLSGNITFHNVTFSYPSRPETPVLQNFNLTIPPNTTTALVGSSGSGKSTVVSLLQRFYDVQGGSICLDGVDIRDLDLKWMRSHMGYVQQEPSMFGLSVKENVMYGVMDQERIGDDEIEAVCKEANAHEFITKFPNQYQTLVGERGVKLSGGQKQRIAIARALLVNPRILLLDEATSALDAESEHAVQLAIDRAVVGRTVLVVAHRLSTIRDADQIVVMDERRILDVGSHEVLVGRCERYRDLIRRQFGGGDKGICDCEE